MKNIIKKTLILAQGLLPYFQQKLSPFLTQHPYWELTFCYAIGLYGIYMALKQDEVNEVVKFIEDHPTEFKKEIVKRKEFQKGFLVFFEQYLKQRLEQKKKILKKILLGFSVTKEKDEYELERLNECLERISLESLTFLIFVKKDVLPKLEAQIQEELKKDQYQKSDRSLEWWFNQMIVTKSVWEVIEKLIYDDYNPDSERVKTMYGISKKEGWISDLRHRAETREREKRGVVNEAMTELVTLGILKTKPANITWGGGGSSDYIFTMFGITFIRLINN